MSATEAAHPTATGNTAIRPFEVGFPEAELDDLRRRIHATRWPERETVGDDSQGASLALMQEVARYWGTAHDWRKCEAKLNALPNFITEIDGLDIHFIHVRSQHEDALPLIVTHGWPGSIIEQLKIIEPLTDPTAHGWGPVRIARAWVMLMKRLGYSRFVAQGGDWGAAVTQTMGEQAAIRSFRRGAARVRGVEQLLCQARGLCPDHGDAPANAVWAGGLTHRPGRVRA